MIITAIFAFINALLKFNECLLLACIVLFVNSFKIVISYPLHVIDGSECLWDCSQGMKKPLALD